MFRVSYLNSPYSTGSYPPTRDNLRILYYNPIRNRDIDLPNTTLSTLPFFKETSVSKTQSIKELRYFVKDVTRSACWIKKKKELRLFYLKINRETIQILCGRRLTTNLRDKSNLYLNKNPSEHNTLIIRGYEYSTLTKDRKL